MKEKHFIELLNLYVDHQIAPEEAAELEAEILRSPERRKTYRDYCRMQRGCGMLFDRDRQDAPASFILEKSLQETERKIVAFPDRRKPGWGTYTAAFGGLTAMAACVAVVFLSSGTPPAAQPREVASVSAVKGPAPLMVASTQSGQLLAPAQTVALSPRINGTQLTFAGQNLTNAREEIAASDRPAGTEWMQQVQLPPVQRVIVDDTTFEARSTLQQDNNRVFRSSRPIQGNVEFTAFQFQR